MSFLYERTSSTSFFVLAAAAGLILTIAALLIKAKGIETTIPERETSGAEPGSALPLLLWGILSFLVVYVFSTLLFVLPVMLAGVFERSPSEIGLMLTAWSLVLFLSQIAGGQWLDRRHWPAPIFTGLLLAGLGLAILSSDPPVGLAVASLVAVAAGDGIAATVTTSLFSKSWERRSPAGTGLGTSFGVVNTVWSLGFLLGSVIGGLVLARELLQDLFLFAGLLFLISAGALALLWTRQREKFGKVPEYNPD
jgi:predicted MFS family arabinose efflux permease